MCFFHICIVVTMPVNTFTKSTVTLPYFCQAYVVAVPWCISKYISVHLEDILVIYSNCTYIIGSQTGQGPQQTSKGAAQ